MTETEGALDARIIDATPRPAIAARVRTPWEELDIGALFDRWFPEVVDRLSDLGGVPSGPPYARYHQFGPEGTDIEFGLPVEQPVANLRPVAETEDGEIGASELPGGELAVTVHRGSYDGLAATYERLDGWIHAQGREHGPAPWESYVDDPSEVADAAELRTEVCWPLA